MARKRTVLCCSASIFLISLGVLLVVVGIVFNYVAMPKIVKHQIKKSKVFKLESDGTYNTYLSDFVNAKYPTYMQYWVFDYKNVAEILYRGVYPDYDERGPYSYIELVNNDNIAFGNDPTGSYMTFSEKDTYIFDPTTSCKGCDPKKDRILVPDIGFVLLTRVLDQGLKGLCALLESMPPAGPPPTGTPAPPFNCSAIPPAIEGIIDDALLPLLGLVMSGYKTGPFVSVTVDEFLYSGYSTPIVHDFLDGLINIIDDVTSLLGLTIPHIPDVRISIFDDNATDWILYRVHTGQEDPSLTGYIKSFTGVNGVVENSQGGAMPADWWPLPNTNWTSNNVTCTAGLASYASQIRGTNGDFVTNFVKKTDTLPIFISDICRSLDLVYDSEATVNGIDGWRFVVPPSVFDYTIPSNCGYCKQLGYDIYDRKSGDFCLPKGLLDISGCQRKAGFAVPIVISGVHFYEADPIVQQFAPRLKAVKETHQVEFIIEPNTGTLLRANKRIQLNLFMNRYEHINSFKAIPPGAYPLLWLNESSTLDKHTKDELNSDLFTPKKIVNIACWCLVGLGVLLVLIGLVIDVYLYTKKND